MFVFGNFLSAIAGVLSFGLDVYLFIVIARTLVSWVNADPYNPIVRFLYASTEPVFYQVRRILPLYGGGIDFTPIIVLVAIYFAKSFLVRTLYDLAFSLR